jgi:hypothetical protein
VLGVAVLSSDRAAVPSTVVVADAVLFPDTESGVVVETDTLLVIDPGVFGAVTVTVMTELSPIPRLGRVQENEPPGPAGGVPQVQPVPLAEANVAVPGSVSVTVKPSATEGPLFVTVTV